MLGCGLSRGAWRPLLRGARRAPPGVASPAYGGAQRFERRCLHQGHVGKTLEKLNLPRHHWLKEVRQAPEKSEIRRQKDRYLRELGVVHEELGGLFRDDAAAPQAVEGSSTEELRQRQIRQQRKEDVNEALRMYRLLRPDAPPFFEEDAMLGMQARMNRTLQEDDGQLRGQHESEQAGTNYIDQQAFLPVVNHRAFLIALESITASLADDVETMCLFAGLDEATLPDKNDTLRFKKLVDALFGAFPLRKDPSRIKEFMEQSWPRLKNFLPLALERLEDEKVEEWLTGHLRRVRLNQMRLEPKIMLHQGRQRFGDEEWYSFSEDFPYDDDPMPGELADERNLGFPLENAGELMRALLGVADESAIAADIRANHNVEAMRQHGDANSGEVLDDVASQFQDFVWDLERVGLRNWLRMDIADLDRFLPKGVVLPLDLQDHADDDLRVAKLMLRCAARDRANLLDFEAVDPYKLLHELPAPKIEEELEGVKPTFPQVLDSDLESMVDNLVARSQEGNLTSNSEEPWLAEGASIEEVFRKELQFYRSAGPAEWLQNKDGEYDWQWKPPSNAFWDNRRGIYVPEQKGVDPSLDLKEMRQHMLDMTRMGSMTRDGRIYYFRAIVVVGNGRGIYGFGIGFGNTPKEARTDAALKGLQNLDYVDMDPGRMLCFPTRGQEYKNACAIIPRPIGRGLLANKKFYPLMYILGLDNCKLKFPNWGGKWFPRVKAIKRALDGIMSRRTLANMTGKRYALLVAPGDHWVHWPDRWFDNIREPYDARAAQIKLGRRHALHFKKRGNTIATSVEARPGWRKENWARWTNPLERWLQHRRESHPYDPAKHREPLGPDARSGGAASVAATSAPLARDSQETIAALETEVLPP